MNLQTFLEKGKDVAFAPPGEYIKDHSFIYHDGRWHLFSISGKIGEGWHIPGNEETFSHSVSPDLIHWEFLEHCLSPGKPGDFDTDMIWAPFVTKDQSWFYLFYTGCTQPEENGSRRTPGGTRKQGLARSKDLSNWEKVPLDPQVKGKDSHVFYDERYGCWILYVMDGTYKGMTAWRSNDLIHWEDPKPAFSNAPQAYQMRNIFESPFVLYYPKWDCYILFLNLGYSLSSDPFSFESFQYYETDLPVLPESMLKPQPYHHPKLGFAGEILLIDGTYIRSSTFGTHQAWKVCFFRVDLEQPEVVRITTLS
jgi:sucrose-6-phosphate hydrolase SacC (GH32 family)